MRILAVDPGAVRVGLAKTDAEGLIGTPLGVIPSKGAAARITSTAEALGAELVVVGLPLNMDGTEGTAAESARRLAEEIGASGLAVELFDERLTTVTAERALIEVGHSRRRRREIADAVAAAVLLEAYLAMRRRRAEVVENG